MVVPPQPASSILVFADIAAMSPGTNTEAPQPVLAMGGELKGTMLQNVEKDTAASLKAVIDKRGRNRKPAAKAVLESESFTEDPALESSLIEVIGKDFHKLFVQLDGRPVIRFDGTEQTLHLAGEVNYE